MPGMIPAMNQSSTAALSWDDLRITLAIAEHGTISSAASALLVSHPTLSRRLQVIERRLGTRLFERTPSSLRLTPAGEEVRQLALRLRDDIAALERRIGGRDTSVAGSVRLTAPDAVSEYLLPPILQALCRQHPGLRIDLIVANEVVPLAQRTADIALRVTSRPADTLRGRQVGTVAMAIYGSRRLAEAHADAVLPPGSPWVGFDAGLACSGPGRWLAGHVAEGDLRIRVNTLLGAAQAVRSGIGYGVLPCFVGGSLPGVMRIGEPLAELDQPLWLLMHPDAARIPRVQAAGTALASAIGQASALLLGRDAVAPRTGLAHQA